MRDIRVLLIGGTSHVGKSTIALALASRLGWRDLSTDSLARHPGRPWNAEKTLVPEHVATHYLSLSVEELTTAQLRHYEQLWPSIEALVKYATSSVGADRLVMEGSGLWPERVAALRFSNIAAFWLTAGAEILKDRIYSASRFHERTADEKIMAERFLGRTEQYNELMLDVVNRLGLANIDVSGAPSIDELVEQLLSAGRPLGR